MTVLISTGGEVHAIIVGEDRKRVIEDVAQRLAYYKIKYSGERTTIKGLTDEDMGATKKRVEVIIKEWERIDGKVCASGKEEVV